MTADQIMHVLRLTAMGRVNHPDQQEFCEKLAKLFAPKEAEVITAADVYLAPVQLDGSPKKRKKAE